jgi:hypothetical protein
MRLRSSASAVARRGRRTIRLQGLDCHAGHRQFVLLHAKALHSNPYDGHTLAPVIADIEKLTGVAVRRTRPHNTSLFQLSLAGY